MKIIKAVTDFGGIVVEFEILGRTQKLLYPLDYTDEQIKSELLKLEEGRKKVAELQEKHKERLEMEAKAQKTIKSLTK